MTEVASSSINTGVSEGSGRVKLVTEPALPATCAICVRSADGTIKFVDFNVSLDYYGAVVICEDCIKECMGLFDYIPKERLEIAKNLGHETLEQLEVAHNELDRYRSVIDTLGIVRPDLDITILADGSKSKTSDEPVSESEQSDRTRVDSESDSDGSDSSGRPEDFSLFAD
jgi:hypothetical protein